MKKPVQGGNNLLSIIQRSNQLIGQNKIEEAFNLILSITLPEKVTNDLLTLQQQWIELNRRRNLNFLSEEEGNRTMSKIVRGILKITSKIPFLLGLTKRELNNQSVSINASTENIDYHNLKKLTPESEVISTTKTSDVEITINRDFNSFSNEDQKKLLAAIASLLSMSPSEIRIKNKKAGSIKLELNLPYDKARQLVELFTKGELNFLGIIKASILADYSEETFSNPNALIFAKANTSERRIPSVNLRLKRLPNTIPKFLLLYLTFDNKELTDFRNYLISDFFDAPKRLVEIFDTLNQAEILEKGFGRKEEETLYQQLNETEALSQKYFQNLKTFFSNHSKSFLSFRQLKINKQEQRRILLEDLKQRDFPIYESETYEFIELVKEQPLNPKNFFLLFQLYQDSWFHPEKDQFTNNITGLENGLFYLDAFYFSTKLFYSCELQNRSAKLNNTPTFLLEDEIIKTFKQIPQNHRSPLAHYYLCILDLFKKPSFSKFSKLKQELFQQQDTFAPAIFTDFLIFLINFAQIQNTKGKVKYPKEGLEIYQFLLNQKLLPQNGIIRPSEYLSIIQLGYHQKLFSWTDDFLIKYEQFLPNMVRTDFLPVVKAFESFYKGDYDMVQQYLNQSKPKNSLQYYHRIMTLLIRGFYEQWKPGRDNLYNVIWSFINALERNLNRNKKLDRRYVLPFKNFIFIMKRLVQNRQKGKDPKSFVPKLFKQLQEKEALALRNWLTEKINTLLKDGKHP